MATMREWGCCRHHHQGRAASRVSAAKLRPRLIEGPSSRSLLVVVNDTPQDQTESITLPSRYRQATDIHTQKPQAIENGAVRVSVPYEDAVILLLE